MSHQHGYWRTLSPFQDPSSEYHDYPFSGIPPEPPTEVALQNGYAAAAHRSTEHGALQSSHRSPWVAEYPEPLSPGPVHQDPRSPRLPPYAQSPTLFPYSGYDYPDFESPDISRLILDDRPSTPQYVGRRARSRASASNPARPASHVEYRAPRGRRKPAPSLAGYKPPSVETAPNSPDLLPSLSSDAGSLLVEDEDYIRNLPQRVCMAGRRQAKNNLAANTLSGVLTCPDVPPLEPSRIPYGSSSAAGEVAASSLPADRIPSLEREHMHYHGGSGPGNRFTACSGSSCSCEKLYQYPALQSTQSPRLEASPLSNGSTGTSDESHLTLSSGGPFSSDAPPQAESLSLIQRSSTPLSEFLSLVPACPKRRPASRGGWYVIPSIPTFHVCEKCFEIHVYDSAFAKYFETVTLADNEKAFCAFNTPRVLNVVWPKTVEANNFDLFVDYANERSKAGTCTSMGFSAKSEVRYNAQGTAGSGFSACSACYQDVILATSFHQFFEPVEAILSDKVVPCHVAWPFIEARLLSMPSDWDEIQRDIDYRLRKVAACPGAELVKEANRRWWKPKGTTLPLRICDCCYWDGVFPTIFQEQFDPVVQDWRDGWYCAMSGYQLSVVWQHAAERGDMKLWLDAANAALSPMCSTIGTSGRAWNVFRDSALDGLDFCDRCTAVFIQPLGLGSRLEKRHYPEDEIIKCDLNPGNEHQAVILSKLGEAAAWRDFTIFKDHIASLAPHLRRLLPCPGTESARRNRWWGLGELKICEECWISFVKPSPFANYIKELELVRDVAEYSCDLGTDEWRYIWQRGCERQDFPYFMEALTLKNKLQSIRSDRLDTLEDLREKGRRGAVPEEWKRKLEYELRELEKDERDTIDMLAVLTRV